MCGLASWIVLVVLVLLAWGQPVAAQSKAPRATELRGMLAGREDRHFFGLESIQPGQAVSLALVFDAAGLAAPEEVNFVVLSEEGLVRFLAGSDLQEVALAVGSPLLYAPQEPQRTAVVPGVSTTGYTVIVLGGGAAPMRYTLQVQGGLLRDDAGQSQSMVMVDKGPDAARPVPPVEVVKPAALAAATEGVAARWPAPASPTFSTVTPVPARRVTGALDGLHGRHFLRLVPELASGAQDTGGEVSLTLQYTAPNPDLRGQLNLWVLTQDGVRQLERGGRIEEWNLAGGSPGLMLAGATITRTTLRVAASVPYVVVVDNQMEAAVAYTLNVEGAVVVDELGQTNEARAAAAEVLALGQ